MMTDAQKGRKSQKRSVGRPRTITTPDEFDRLVDLYILSCQDPEKPRAITLTGLILALGLSSRQSLDEYASYDGFSDSVKRAKLLVEHEYEQRLVVGTSAAGSIFALKNFGWMDKHPTQLDELQVEKLKRELQIDDEEVQPTSVVIGVRDASKQKA